MQQTISVKKQGKVRQSTGDMLFDVLNMVIWIVLLFMVLYPIYLVFIASISDPEAIHSGKTLLYPVDVSFIGYGAVFKHRELWTSYGNAIFYTVVGATASVTVTMMAAYAISRKFLGRGLIVFLFVFTMFFSGGLIPIFLNVQNLGLYDTRAVMILLNLVSVWNLMIARTYIQTAIPNELYEAAVMDGMSHFSYFFRVVLPLSGTIIAVLAVYYGVARWNDYFTGLIMLRDRSKIHLQTLLREIIATNSSSSTMDAFYETYAGPGGLQEQIRKAESIKYCCIMVSTVPAVVLYMSMQKYFVKGVMIGSLKG
jgi:putative aldouronate transport system permease protein